MKSRDEHITTLFKSGFSQRAIAKAVGVSQPAIHKRLHRQGLIPLPSDSSTVTSHEEGRDNRGQERTMPDNPPAQDENAVPPSLLSAQAHVAGRQYEEDGDKVRDSALPQGALRCGICGGPFKPQRPGQRFCCNACGAKAAGYQPVVEHAEHCLLLR